MLKARNAKSDEAPLRADRRGASRRGIVALIIAVAVLGALLGACAQQGQLAEQFDGAQQGQIAGQYGGVQQKAAVAERTDGTAQALSASGGDDQPDGLPGDAGQEPHASQALSSTDSEAAEEAAEHEVYEPDVVLARFKEDLDVQEALRTLEQETGMAGLSLSSQGEGYVKLALPDGVAVEQALEAFGHSEVVESAQPNFRYYLMDDLGADAGVGAAAVGAAAGVGADAEAGAAASAEVAIGQLQAGMTSGLFAQSLELDDPYADKLWGLSSVRALDAWETMRCNHSVTVAVIDNVFLANHEDLKRNVVVAYNANTKKKNDDIAGASYSGGDKQHGTHVAGIIAAQADNGIGVAGVSYNAKLLLIRTATDDAEFYTEALMNAYDYLISKKDVYNVRVVNMSLGGYMENDDWAFPDDNADDSQEGVSQTDDYLLQAIDRAWDAGIITVTSAGNAGTYGGSYVPAPFSCYPGDYDRCVNVMNLYNKSGGEPTDVERNSGSNYNLAGRTNKDISAPGSTIYSTTVGSSSSYASSTGTSMAAPCVAGVLALMFATYPDLSAEQAVEVLYETARDLDESNDGFDQKYGYGEVDALAAVQACLEMAEAAGYHPSIPDYPTQDAADNDDSDDSGDDATPDVKPSKLRNPLNVSAKLAKVKVGRLKAKKKVLARKKVLAISDARGTLTFRKLSGSSRLKIAKSTGKVTVRKGTKRGTYRMKVRVRASGNSKYKCRVKTVTVRVRVG